MLDFFNEILQCFQKFVSMFFNDLSFVSGVSIGWLLLTMTIFSIVINYVFGRFK